MSSANACADDAAFAQDIDSGTGSPNSCSSANKDRHVFYDYGFNIPAASTIDTIEVRLDAWADALAPAGLVCVELSWDGGTSWTAAMTTPNLLTSEATFLLGGVASTWGRPTWDASDFSNANFRVRATDRSSAAGRDFFLDWIAVQVTYTAP